MENNVLTTERYVMDLTPEQNGFNDVHKINCAYLPRKNYEKIGDFNAPGSAVIAAKLKYPYRKIKGCYFCSSAW